MNVSRPTFAPSSIAAAWLALAGCSSSSTAGPGGTDDAGADTASVDTGAPGDGVSADVVDTASSDAPSETGEASGTGTVTGTVGGASFGTVLTGFLIGAPDDPTTTAVYLVDRPLHCSDISASGWSHTITAGTHVFELIFNGTTPGTYKVAASATAGQVEVNFIVAAPTRNETRGSAGSADLTTLVAKTSAKGTFSVQFPDGTSKADGTFDVVYCPTGHEP